ncbi:hypothetical protein CONLIGDRAFT_249597 [Coniochaeta ligniaria NRRL 30616]|uniref:Uncharacterized protein n=1 Tax=Coniochaeta ligniaria NRRL 30616 TaxID=1408157 RepID=A0A1J7JPZ4_9PEZI|nr:hypothetical protein CONLIGDRAFT_249597 [Coniochaeta ligniaria NRRL 30616]
MATHRDSRIKSRPPPTDNGTNGTGIFSRLLQRTKSKKGRKQADNEDHYTTNTNSEVPEPSFHAPATVPLITPPQTDRQATSAPPASTMGAPIVHQQQPPPMLKKRPSIRDRFRSLAKDAPTPTPEPGKQRIVYVPTHAAADFSRLALTPRPMSRQQQRHSYDEPWTAPQHASEPLTPIAAHPAEEEPQNPAGPRHVSQRALETLDENEPVQGTSAQGQIERHVPEIDAPHEKEGPSPNNTKSLPARVHETPGHDRIEKARSEKEAQQLSDYELFLARAEERERAHREHLLRTLSQRQYPRPEPEVNQYHPRNSATYTADSAVVAEASGLRRKGWEGRMSGLDSGIGSKSSSQGDGAKLQSEEPTSRGSNTGERGHRKRASWTPSFGAGGRDAERKLERGSDVVPELDEGYRPDEAQQYTTSRNNTSSFAERSYAAQQPRTLKRQTSMKQKLGAYIKPARPPTRYQEPELTRGKSKRVP